ncbi:MAG: peptidyl-prolyl cis-trans isomerase [Deltaproteobacteria bacterium]|nr:peptidyl-prolyl cis-trans isomerase [Deltaproteobacteria bacterium]
MLSSTQISEVEAANPVVILKTNYGDIALELYIEKAPKTVENFLNYVKDGFYDETIFHRVIKGFMIQGGGLTPALERKKTKSPVPNEADNALKNLRGTIAMARTMDPHSATSQFFINTVDNPFLDYKNKTIKGWGYCVFGKVVEGMKVVEEIEHVPTAEKGSLQNVPTTTIIIKQAKIKTFEENPKNKK